MAKNRRLSDDDDSDYEPTKRQKGPPQTRPPLYKAEVIETPDSTSIKVNSSTADLDNTLLMRMKKCLTRAKHPDTPEHEAKAALRIACRFMRTYNVRQSELLAHDGPEEQRMLPGSSLVVISRRDGNKDINVGQQNFIDTLCAAMEAFFSCKYLTQAVSGNLEIEFHGIAENTVAAASALEMVYNLIVEWARPYKGTSGKNSYCYGISDELLVTAERENEQEEERVKRADKAAMAAQLKQERADDQARLERLQASVDDEEDASTAEKPTTTPSLQVSLDMDPSTPGSDDEEAEYSDWDGFEDDDDEEPNDSGTHYVAADSNDTDNYGEHVVTLEGVDDEIKRLVADVVRSNSLEARELSLPFRTNKPEEPMSSPTETRRDSVQSEAPQADEPGWKSHMQLVKFRETSRNIAEEWRKAQGIKVYAGRKRAGPKDWAAFREGQKDSKKIDVRRRTIAANSKEERQLGGDLLMAFT